MSSQNHETTFNDSFIFTKLEDLDEEQERKLFTPQFFLLHINFSNFLLTKNSTDLKDFELTVTVCI